MNTTSSSINITDNATSNIINKSSVSNTANTTNKNIKSAATAAYNTGITFNATIMTYIVSIM